MGKGDLAKMDSGQMDDQDRGLTKAGMICGIIACILLLIGIAVAAFTLLAGGAVAATN